MFRHTTSSIAALAVGIATLVAVSPATAAQGMQHQDQYINDYCTSYPSADQCPDWRMNHGHWSSYQYRAFYMRHQHSVGFDGDIAAGIFGFAVGAILSTAASNDENDESHIVACQDRYRSYDVDSDMYLGYDGIHHECLL